MSNNINSKICIREMDDRTLTLLKNAGMPGDVLSVKEFDPDKYIKTFFPLNVRNKNLKLKPIKITRDDQINSIRGMYSSKPYIACINGVPHDLKAKALAAHIASTMLDSVRKPLWFSIYDRWSFKKDPRLQKYEPNLIIISNLTVDSSNIKFEYARDLLERFSYLPRIVICNSIDPIQMGESRLYSPINYPVQLVSKRVEVLI